LGEWNCKLKTEIIRGGVRVLSEETSKEGLRKRESDLDWMNFIFEMG